MGGRCPRLRLLLALGGGLAAAAGAENGTAGAVAVYLVGEPRTLNYTFCSLRDLVIAPLQVAGYTVTLFVAPHRHPTAPQYRLLDRLPGVRVHTALVPTRPHRPPDGCVRATAARLKAWPPAYSAEYLTRLHSRERANALRAAVERRTGTAFQWVLLVRPDVLFLDRLDPAALFAAPDAIAVPDWQSFGGVNDRFAAVPRAHADAVFGLYSALCTAGLAASATGGNSEQIHLWHLRRTGLRARGVRSLRFLRIRMDIFRDPSHRCACPLAPNDRLMVRSALRAPTLALCTCGGGVVCGRRSSVASCARLLLRACERGP